MARALYSEPVEFKPQFKMYLCCNHLPEVPADDNGTWRRLRVCKFVSKFTDDPDETEKYEFRAEQELSQKLEDWKESFIAMLIEYYKLYKTNGIVEPDEVKVETNEYRANNDVYAEFINDSIEVFDEGCVLADELWMFFRNWYKMNYPTSKQPHKRDLNKYFNKKYGKKKLNRKNGWKGIRLTESGNMSEEDDD